jgi:hypothetical protein
LMHKQNLAASEVQTYKLLLYDYKKTWCINESDIAIKTRHEPMTHWRIGGKNSNPCGLPATDQLINWCNECNSLFWDRCEVDNHTIIEDIATKITWNIVTCQQCIKHELPRKKCQYQDITILSFAPEQNIALRIENPVYLLESDRAKRWYNLS